MKAARPQLVSTDEGRPALAAALTEQGPMNAPGLVVDRAVPEIRKIDASKLA